MTDLPQSPQSDKVRTLIQQVQNVSTRISGYKDEAEQGVSYSQLYQFATPSDKVILIIGWLFAVGTGAGLPSLVFLLGNSLDAFDETPQEMLDETKTLSTYYGAISVGMWVTTYIYFLCFQVFAERVTKTTRVRYLQAILKQESAWYDLTSHEELSSRISKECEAIQKALGEKMGQVVFSLSMNFFGLLFAILRGWSFSLVVLATFPLVVLVGGIMMSLVQVGFAEQLKAYGQSGGYAEQALNAIRVVACFGQEEKEASNYEKHLVNSLKIGKRLVCKLSIMVGMFMFVVFGDYAFCFFVGTVWKYNEIWNHTFDRAYTAGDIVSCFFGVIFGMMALAMAAPNFKAISEGKIAGKMVFDIINRTPSIPTDDPQGRADKILGKIEFKDIRFVYPSRPEQVILDNFNFEFEVGKTTAIVGPSGSGKSTIVQLIERFYDPIQGQVLIDGTDLREFNLRAYRMQVGYVGQEPVLFNTSIKNNLLMGNPEATDDEIAQALKYANADGIIKKEGQRWQDFDVGQAGTQLSGGQKQRIAIARAFVRKPKILIFDEATSALDKKNEADVQRAIDQIRGKLGQVTTIVIAHRLSTIRNADRIVVLNKGKIDSVGNHQSLLKEYPDGLYAKLVKQQEEVDQKDSPQKQLQANPNYDTLEDQVQNEVQTIISDVRAELGLKDPLPPHEQAIVAQVDSLEAEEEATYLSQVEQAQKQNFIKRIDPYNRPRINIILGLAFSCVKGFLFPCFGVFLVKIQFGLMLDELEEMKETAWIWSLYLFLMSVVAFFSTAIYKACFGLIGENITFCIRKVLYAQILKKDIGWFDSKDNSAGSLTSTLSKDATTLNGVSFEGFAVVVEATFSLLCGIAIAFSFSWKVSLICLGAMPLLALGGAIQAKVSLGDSKEEIGSEQASNQVLSESILNYKTVFSLANDSLLIHSYERSLSQAYPSSLRKAHLISFGYGFSQCIQNAFFALVFYVGAQISVRDRGLNGEKIFMAIFAMLFGSFAAGQANQYGADMGKARKAASKIFALTDVPSKINAVDIPEGALPINKSTFQGHIQFQDVWFRYPSRKSDWIFKGLNLQIAANDSVAIVGESGAGKSTLASLLLRFYDPCHGCVLVDGVDIRRYNLKDLRRTMGVVMQEPTLFNYTIKENILYGQDRAMDSEVAMAAQIANAKEFIEAAEIGEMFEDSGTALLLGWQQLEGELLRAVGQQEYEKKLKLLKFQAKKEEKEGKFLADIGAIDQRSSDCHDLVLAKGYETVCGIRGSKLSGGQKQRVAIARAVIRQPLVLVLDEATSALDEEAQQKVQVALERVMEGRTSIVIAHRLTTVEKCKRVVVLEGGKVAEEGTLGQLKGKSDGYFAKVSEKMRKGEQRMARIGTI